MSGVSWLPLSRRQLLKGGLALAACAWTLRPDSILADEPPVCKPDCTRWALLSDTHIADLMGTSRRGTGGPSATSKPGIESTGK